ncbi:hypothetical protein JDV02_000012 [Purpureocillium takamizusanense]|uniref:Uncharacterized protein n=1 Tax=Purpureocillium takamizusanense TaxID=2060973 RepID=A0A9Q8Q5A0_9HYPO|nr:uncharacterized protein JDV02_000012 [Purpureocillium takamizusanense]UNI13255.1 hypothetical protein JDV02_000012 [Purpureocillium takamizusanense]
MALWPFRRKSSRKRSRSGAALSDGEGPQLHGHDEGVAAARAASKKKQRTEPVKLRRRPRTYSFSPGRNDSIRVDRPHAARQPAGRAGGAADTGQQELGWTRTPTLHHRINPPPSRRRSSKRRREDHEREAEIKAMSAHMPTRLGVDASTTGGALTKQSSKRAKTNATTGQWDKPTSNISLPLPDSIRSSRSSDSDFVAYKISALDSLAPRPTLRYAQGSRWTPSRASDPAASGTQKKRIAEWDAIPEGGLDSRKRIDDLADGLDASDLRELMERDNRRRERKRQLEQERVERRLARRAEKQRRDEAEARKSGTPPPENLERGVLGRELVGLGIDPPSAVVTSSKRRASPTGEPLSELEQTSSKEPLESFHRSETLPKEESTETDHQAAAASTAAHTKLPAAREAQASTASQGSLLGGLLRAKKSLSKSTLGSDKDRMVVDDEPRKDSVGSNKHARLSITSFLRWGGRSRRNSGPSSFSNTSREEMQAAAQAQAEALAKLQGEDVSHPNYLASKVGAAPKRTRSRFREDLPDFPLSPPDSRVQSPESEPPPLPMVAEVKTPETESRPTVSSRLGTPSSAPRLIEGAQAASRSDDKVYGAQSVEDPYQSISLASIDSEGSWLSGRIGSKRSATLRDSIAKANHRDHAMTESPSSGTPDEAAITDDDYLSRLAPRRHSGVAMAGRPSGEGRPSSDEDEPMREGDVKWGAVGARPHLVQYHLHNRDTMRSHEVLMNMESGDDDSEVSPVSPVSPVSLEKADVQRARSVNVGQGHSRNFSAGSARLLDIYPRESLEKH